ncbi:hypothetical protein GQ600_25178 [Phytophthora cactorum]|nr:hypothetical protein GQ600_25178 [Phytophthora cactorum]
MWYFRTRNDNGSSNLGFIDGHPLQSTHRLGKRVRGCCSCNTGLSYALCEHRFIVGDVGKYAVLSLALFKPFRAAHDIIGDSDSSDEESWIDAFQSWKNTRSEFVIIMDNMNDYYSGSQKVEDQSKAAKRPSQKLMATTEAVVIQR